MSGNNRFVFKNIIANNKATGIKDNKRQIIKSHSRISGIVICWNANAKEAIPIAKDLLFVISINLGRAYPMFKGASMDAIANGKSIIARKTAHNGKGINIVFGGSPP